MFNIEHIIQSGGLIAIALIIFAESGLLLGFFLPGDSLLLLAGIFASQNSLPLPWLLAVAFLAAVIGYEVGYVIGEKAGPKVFKCDDGILFRREYIDKTNAFFTKYGPVAVIMARFVPIVRTFLSVTAGMGKMDRKRYTTYNVIGALLWITTITMLGYYVGEAVPNIDKYMVIVVFGVILLSVGGALWHIFKYPDARKKAMLELKNEWRHLFGASKK